MSVDVERADEAAESFNVARGEPALSQVRLGPANVVQEIWIMAEARDRVAHITLLLRPLARIVRVLADEAGERKHDDVAAMQLVEDSLHLPVLGCVQRPEARGFPSLAATFFVAVEIVARDRERVVALRAEPVEKRGALRVGPVRGEEP